MSVIQSLIKQAFGTGNSNEAATFLASACNRMKAMDKTTIAREVESALRGVSFSRTESDKAKVKTVYKDTAVTLEKLASLEKQVRSLTNELAVARNQTRDTEDAERMKGELLRLNTRISELLRESDIQRKQHVDELALLRSRQRAAGNSTSAELDAANSLIAYTGSQMAAMAAARDTLQQRLTRLETETEHRLREEEDKRHAANRRADGNYALLGQQKELTAEANRKITQLRASLKLEEYEGQNAKNEKAKLKKQIAGLEDENSRLAERLRDNEEDCERLSNALERTNQELVAYKTQKERLTRWIHVPGAMMGVSVVALVLYSDAQPGHLFDSLAPAVFLGCVVYALSLMIAFTRRA
ncbi:hypothetical protein GRAQ_04705 [Rahnella aquatilis CIP 78.65 = ATCC 33071]|uniref:Uncharacterized protein n=1 Tax=Rahnella aquatilis (strain ATCC 33071 / DSM 4594 / JCM 1683 / NBRC 105701 / NCIMB 13365 / CIP 78.65) TaxID=745277 RepID=H2J1M1_RAHAC|nr:hypothetical protein [Rahnella aquatilis]AEX54468.1 hypothetical protein Rahaq2_4745 [Rahnella aquatilis CIP 78.65 = ATCC 33071]KFC99927.1 hypothetical protein GRAQ_04705 [Rahnella aquatilis CIP 78.65 = ATCC 33071]